MLQACVRSQAEVMDLNVPWPGFHALCIESVDQRSVSVLLHKRSPGVRVPRNGRGSSALVRALTRTLKQELGRAQAMEDDPTLSWSPFEHPPTRWRLFTNLGAPVTTDVALRRVGPGSALWLFTGGQFIWPGVRIGHSFSLPTGTKRVTMTTLSLRPLVFSLSSFLSADECSSIKSSAKAVGLLPSAMAHVDSARAAGKPASPRMLPRRVLSRTRAKMRLSPALSLRRIPVHRAWRVWGAGCCRHAIVVSNLLEA
jgi:hypothetical protein